MLDPNGVRYRGFPLYVVCVAVPDRNIPSHILRTSSLTCCSTVLLLRVGLIDTWKAWEHLSRDMDARWMWGGEGGGARLQIHTQ